MEREGISRLIGGLLGLSSLGAIGALGLVLGGAPAPVPGKPEGDWRLLEPVSYEKSLRKKARMRSMMEGVGGGVFGGACCFCAVTGSGDFGGTAAAVFGAGAGASLTVP